MSLVSTVLTIYIWGVVCILVYFLFAIARFYERKSGRRSFYSFFLIPIALFAIAAVRHVIAAPLVVGDTSVDLLRSVGGVVLGGFGLFLLKLMMGGRS